MKQRSADISVHGDREALVRQAALRLQQAGQLAIAERGRFVMATCGGNLARQVLEAVTPADLQWRDAHVFACSGCIDRDVCEGVDPRSWFGQLPAPRQNVHCVPLNSEDSNAAASAYEQQIRAYFGVAGGELPRFDLIVIQLGIDGHAASLFPGSSSLHETGRLAVAEYVRSLGTHCVTFSAPLINQARTVLLLAAGSAVAGALRETIAGRFEPERIPAQLLNPVAGRLHVLADAEAARELRG